MGVSGRASKISSVVAVICIAIYIAAIAFGAVQIIVNINERRNLAESEFYDFADRASSSAVFLGFMSETYQQTIMDFLGTSETLLGIIISFPGGEYAFERYPGSGIVWAGNSPRLKTGTGFPGEPFRLPLRIEGQRNVNIQAVYTYIDRELFLGVFKNTLLAVLFALAVAFVTLMLELIQKNKPAYRGAGVSGGFGPKPKPAQKHARDLPEIPAREIPIPEPVPEAKLPPADDLFTFDEGENPQGLYSPRGNIGWESYIHDRLASEIHRCASFEQDLVFLSMEFPGDEKLTDNLYRQFADEAVSFFLMRDLVFEKGDNGICVIIPSTDLEQAMTKSEEFRNRLIAKLPKSFEGRTKLCIGISSRSGRLIEAERLILEASGALKKAALDPDSPIIAFKSDPDKYRELIRGHI